jgi:beta-lactamase regulating signal transducer with metallopeptidase domain
MSVPSVDGHLQTVVYLIIKVSVLLAMGEMVNAVLRRRTSAATRHLVWTLTVVALLLLPILSAVLPGWRVPIRLMATAAPDAAETGQRARLASPLMTGSDAGVSSLAVGRSAGSLPTAGRGIDIPWSTALAALYAAGVLLLLARLIVEQVTIQRLARRATAMSDPEITRLLLECAQRMGVRRPLRLLRSGERTMPMVFGTRAPAIVLPDVADTWSQDRRRAVLLHELAHVARYDCLTQLTAAVACAVYWIHPGVWWTARRLRVERELACDDRVLTAGIHAREYAGHLLDLAYSLDGRRAPATAASMARPRQLEGRMLAMLDTARNRAAPARRSYLAGIAIMTALLAPLAGAEPAVARGSADSPSLADLTLEIDEGPATMIQSIEFVGNRAIGSGTLKRQMKGNQDWSIWTRMFAGPRTYQEATVDEDVEKVLEYYRDHGFITARVGAPELKLVRESPDRKTRFVSLRIPVVEGHRYRIGSFGFDGNTTVKSDELRTMFKVEPGTYYSERAIRNGLMKAREAYGAAGYFEFTGYPDYKFRNVPGSTGPAAPEALQADAPKPPAAPPIVDVTMRLGEGKQFFVNRLTLIGSTTRGRLIRGEVRLVEGGVFNTEALKYSIKRLNQLGYFKPIEGTRDVDVHKTPGEDNKVDVNLRLEDR